MSDVLYIDRGDAHPLVWALTGEDGDPLDTDGYSARAEVRRDPSAPTVLHEWSSTAQPATATLSGQFVSLSVEGSEDWTWGRGMFVLHVIDPEGRPTIVERCPVILR